MALLHSLEEAGAQPAFSSPIRARGRAAIIEMSDIRHGKASGFFAIL
jgi:hypothetical protein